MPPQFGAVAPRCPRCGDRVYAAEQVLGPASTPYHRHCLRCIVCSRRLDSVSLLEHDAQPFCSACHKTQLGQGRGAFGTAVPLRPTIDTEATARAARQATLSPSRSAPRMSTIPAQTPAPAPAPAQAPTAAPGGMRASSSLPRITTTTATTSSGTPLCARGHTPVCASLANKTDFAEQRQACGRKWHRACLRCDGCRATLDPGKVQDGPADAMDADAPSTWCRNCYARVCTLVLLTQRFGPRGIGVAGTSYPR